MLDPSYDHQPTVRNAGHGGRFPTAAGVAVALVAATVAVVVIEWGHSMPSHPARRYAAHEARNSAQPFAWTSQGKVFIV